MPFPALIVPELHFFYLVGDTITHMPFPALIVPELHFFYIVGDTIISLLVPPQIYINENQD
jgi:hypothetical protein